MALYEIAGNTHERLQTEGAAEIDAAGNAAISTVLANIDAIKAVAAQLGNLGSIPDALAQALAYRDQAQASATAAAQAAASVGDVESRANSAITEARNWAISPNEVEVGSPSSKTSADTAKAARDEAALSAASATTASAAAVTAADLADRYANALPGQEVTPGRYSALDRLVTMEALLAQAPTLQGRVIEGGTDNVTTTENLLATDFFNIIEVNRAATRKTKIKALTGLFTQAPKPGYARAYGWVYILNRGLADVIVEGPGDPSTPVSETIMASLIAGRTDVNSSTIADATAPEVNTTVNYALTVPAAADRKAIITVASIHHASPLTSDVQTVVCPELSNITMRTEGGLGGAGSSSPIRFRMWTADLAGSAEATLNAVFTLPKRTACYVVRISVYQDCSGFDSPQLTVRTGTGTSEQVTITPTVAKSVIAVIGAHQGADANPVSLTNIDAGQLQQGKTGSSTQLKDISFAIGRKSDATAEGHIFVASSSKSGPGLVGGIALKPVTRTTGGGGSDNMTYDGSRPATIPPGGSATLIALGDGISYHLDM